jgi:hypothetical protein
MQPVLPFLFTSRRQFSIISPFKKQKNMIGGWGVHCFLAFSYCKLYFKINKKNEVIMRRNFPKKILTEYRGLKVSIEPRKLEFNSLCTERKWANLPLSLGRVWIYQRGKQNPYIEEEQTTQWPKETVQKDKQRSTKHTHKTKDRVKGTHTKYRGWTQVFRKDKQFLFQ